MSACKHAALCFEPSSNAEDVGYKRETQKRLRNAASLGGRADPEARGPDSSTFPAPLVLPGDELSWSPKSHGDDVQTWMNGRWRNPVTPVRRTLYLAAMPSFAAGTEYAADWAKPQIRPKGKSKAAPPRIACPTPENVLGYLRAFYHPLPVKFLTKPGLQFVEWNDKKDRSRTSRIGLSIGDEAIGIRHRVSKDGLFNGQLNLSDLLDAAITILPNDSYALLMILDHDLYEDEEDDFCCGRAYGGSRVAVVSMARYHPLLDIEHDVDRTHAWPASHCQKYMEDRCRYEDEEEAAPVKRQETNKNISQPGSALQTAVNAHSALTSPRSAEALSNLWLGRVCKTASHELGHCFGIDHCGFYACIMQGTAGIPEDARQPPYLCPIDLVKVLHATGADEAERYRVLFDFCKRFSGDKLFSAFAAWLEVRLGEVQL